MIAEELVATLRTLVTDAHVQSNIELNGLPGFLRRSALAPA